MAEQGTTSGMKVRGGCPELRGQRAVVGHSCQPQGSLPSVAEDYGEEQSSSVPLTPVFLPYQGPCPRCRGILLQQHPLPCPARGGSAGSIWAALAKSIAPSSPGSVFGLRARFPPNCGICSRIKAKGGDAGRGLLIAASPPQGPSRCAWPAASTDSSSCDGVEAAGRCTKPWYPGFQAGKGARKVWESRRGTGSARQPAAHRDRRAGWLRGDTGRLLDLLGFGRWLSGRHRAAKPTAPKFQLVLILSEMPQSGATAIPPGLPWHMPKRTCH